MTPTDGKTITLRGKSYVLRFTLPRLRDVTQKTGKGLYALNLESLQLNPESLVRLLWVAIAHPENGLQKATIEDVAALLEMNDLRRVSQALNEEVNELLKEPEDPQQPTVQ